MDVLVETLKHQEKIDWSIRWFKKKVLPTIILKFHLTRPREGLFMKVFQTVPQLFMDRWKRLRNSFAFCLPSFTLGQGSRRVAGISLVLFTVFNREWSGNKTLTLSVLLLFESRCLFVIRYVCAKSFVFSVPFTFFVVNDFHLFHSFISSALSDFPLCFQFHSEPSLQLPSS